MNTIILDISSLPERILRALNEKEEESQPHKPAVVQIWRNYKAYKGTQERENADILGAALLSYSRRTSGDSMIIYIRRDESDTWHWCTNCSNTRDLRMSRL